MAAAKCLLGVSMRCQWILACALVSGCVAYQPKPLDALQLAQGFGERSLREPGLRAYLERESGHPPATWPAVRWNRQMLTLAAGYYSPALAGARAQQEAARAGAEAAGARPNPT